MAHKVINIAIIFLLLATTEIRAQNCYEITLSETRTIVNNADRLLQNGNRGDAARQYLNALRGIRSTRDNCRSIPANHELGTWEDRCIDGIMKSGYQYDRAKDEIVQLVLRVTPNTLEFDDKGDEKTIAVTATVSNWRVTRSPSWCTVTPSSNRLIIKCHENTGSSDRNDVVIISGSNLEATVSILQTGKVISDPNRMKITDVQFASNYANGTMRNYGQNPYNNMTLLVPRVIYDNLASDSKRIILDYKIIDPNGRLITPAGSTSKYTNSEVINTSGNFRKNDVIDFSSWGDNSGKIFSATGTYSFEIWCSEVKLISAGFEVLQNPIQNNIEVEKKKLEEEKTAWEKKMEEENKRLEDEKNKRLEEEEKQRLANIENQRLANAEKQTPKDQDGLIPLPRLKFGIGIKGGLNMSNIRNDMTDIDYVPEMRHDFHAGALLNFRFGYRNKDFPGVFALQPEFLYSRQGFTFKGDDFKFNYLTGLFMIKLYAKGFNFEVGPWISYLMTVDPYTVTFGDHRINLTNLEGGKDAGVAAGIGYEFDFGVAIGVRYMYGLSDMADNLLWKNSVIAVSLGWIYKF